MGGREADGTDGWQPLWCPLILSHSLNNRRLAWIELFMSPLMASSHEGR